MSLPKKGKFDLPPLDLEEEDSKVLPDINSISYDEDFILEEEILEDDSIQELSDSDFGINQNEEVLVNNSIDTIPNEDLQDNQVNDDLEQYKNVEEQEDIPIKKKVSILLQSFKKPSIKKLNIEIFKNNKNTKLLILPAIVIFVLFGTLKIFKNTSWSSNMMKNSSDKFSFVKEEYSGVVFKIKPNSSHKVNIQRIYKESNGNVVLCETGQQEVTKDKEQEMFAECLNPIEEVKGTSKTKVLDNLVIYKE